MISIIRLANETNRQDLAAHLLELLVKAIQAKEELNINEPFISPASDYDHIDAQNRLGEFIQSSIIHQKILTNSFSSYFNLKDSIQDFQLHAAQGIDSPKLTQRFQAITQLTDSLSPQK